MSESLFSTDAARWHAVVSRDLSADGEFVYCVKTTKVCCRPVCKARLARRTNVVFFPTAKAALEAGYRPCKRCKPELGQRMPDEEATTKILNYLDSRAGLVDSDDAQSVTKADTLEAMSREAGLSKWHFHRKFKEVTGMTPAQYVARDKKKDPDLSMQAESLSAIEWPEDMFDGFEPSSNFEESWMQKVPTQSLWVDESDQWQSNVPMDQRGMMTVTANAIDTTFVIVPASSVNHILVVLSGSSIRMAQSCPSEMEAVGALERNFPAAAYDYYHLRFASLELQEQVKPKIDQIIQLLQTTS